MPNFGNERAGKWESTDKPKSWAKFSEIRKSLVTRLNKVNLKKWNNICATARDVIRYILSMVRLSKVVCIPGRRNYRDHSFSRQLDYVVRDIGHKIGRTLMCLVSQLYNNCTNANGWNTLDSRFIATITTVTGFPVRWYSKTYRVGDTAPLWLSL